MQSGALLAVRMFYLLLEKRMIRSMVNKSCRALSKISTPPAARHATLATVAAVANDTKKRVAAMLAGRAVFDVFERRRANV